MTDILQDEKIVSFRKAFDNGEFSFDTDKYIEEVKNIHITRGIRTMNSEDIFNHLNKVIDAVLQNQACRSRVVEIKMMCTMMQTKINTRKESLTNYILVKYREALKANYKTQADRKAYIDELFSYTITNSLKIQTLQNFCDLIIQDIDNASWALKSVIDCLKMSDAVNKVIS